jgi:hypothetical protein
MKVLVFPLCFLVGALAYGIPAYLHDIGRAQLIAAKAALTASEKCGGRS